MAQHQTQDLTGMQINSWKVLSRLPRDSRGQAVYLCRCRCGLEFSVVSGRLLNGQSRQCKGCSKRKHGLSKSRGYSIWKGMHRRCYSVKSEAYDHYGGRGITVCDRWHDYELFLLDMGEPGEGMSIDRIDNDGPYSPGNCRWVTNFVQSRNRRSTILCTINGVTKCVLDWAADFDVPPGMVYRRISRGWEPVDALTRCKYGRTEQGVKILIKGRNKEVSLDKGEIKLLNRASELLDAISGHHTSPDVRENAATAAELISQVLTNSLLDSSSSEE